MPKPLTPNVAMTMLARRYKADPEAIISVLCPLLIPIHSIGSEILIIKGQNHAHAAFSVRINDENRGVLVRGRTGKFVPASYDSGTAEWREIAKGRIISVDYAIGVAHGEIYTGFGSKKHAPLQKALDELSKEDYLEIDQYGVAPKALSGLAEYYLAFYLRSRGYDVVRMPEDMAAHLGAYMNFDFVISHSDISKRLEVKSL